MGLNVVFAGTSTFALPALEALQNSNHQIVAVLTQPDRPAGRGRKLCPSPVKLYAESNNLPVFTFDRLNAQACEHIMAFNADALVVVSYGLLIPSKLLEAFPHGGINIHPSLLPRWRGAAPIPRALLAGDTQTGVCIMQMTSELDAGDIYHQETIDISDQDTTQSLETILSSMGSSLLMKTLDELFEAPLDQTPQDTQGLCYAEKIERSEAKLNWNDAAISLSRQVRAFNPKPGAFCLDQNHPVKIWSASAQSERTQEKPGTVTAVHKDSIDVATGDGILRITELQPSGKKRLSVNTYLLGHTLEKGHVFS